jgi:hypothetical protein
MHGNAKVGAAVEKFVGPKAKRGSARRPAWAARLGANPQFLTRHHERLNNSSWVAVEDYDVLTIARCQSPDDRHC